MVAVYDRVNIVIMTIIIHSNIMTHVIMVDIITHVIHSLSVQKVKQKNHFEIWDLLDICLITENLGDVAALKFQHILLKLLNLGYYCFKYL